MIFLIGSSAALAMNPFHSMELEPERKSETNENPARRSTEENNPSSSIRRNNFAVDSWKEKSSNDERPFDLTMNLSAPTEPAAPLITLEQCQEAIEKYPKAANLIIQKELTETVSRVAPPTFYNHFISAFPEGLMGRNKTPDENISEKSRQITTAVFEMLEHKYGKEIAHASFSSAPHRIAIAHPLSSKDLSQSILTAELLHKNGLENFPSNLQIEELRQQAEAATAKVVQATNVLEKKNALLDEKNKIAREKTTPYQGHLGASALELAFLEGTQRAAHKEAIDIKDRLARAYHTASKSDDLSNDDYLSEGTPLLGRDSKRYGSISSR